MPLAERHTRSRAVTGGAPALLHCDRCHARSTTRSHVGPCSGTCGAERSRGSTSATRIPSCSGRAATSAPSRVSRAPSATRRAAPRLLRVRRPAEARQRALRRRDGAREAGGGARRVLALRRRGLPRLLLELPAADLAPGPPARRLSLGSAPGRGLTEPCVASRRARLPAWRRATGSRYARGAAGSRLCPGRWRERDDLVRTRDGTGQSVHARAPSRRS